MKENIPQPESQIQIRSEEIQEIINHPPNWIVRSGISLIFFVVIVLLAISWFVKYPDTIKAGVTITTSPPPLSLVTRASGNLILLTKENDVVRKGDVVAYLSSTTNFQHLLSLEKELENPLWTTKSKFELGELQPYYSAFLTSSESSSIFKRNDIFNKQISQQKKQIKNYMKLKRSLSAQSLLMFEELTIAHERFKRDSTLYVNKVISPLQYEDAKSAYLQQKRNLKNTEISITNNEIQISQLENQVMELEAQKSEQEIKYEQGVNSAHRELLARIAKWRETYLLTAQEDGKVAHLGFLENRAYVEAGEKIFSIVPNTTQLNVQAELPSTGSGKVKEGQDVNIRLENFPHEQFGLLRGKVTEISSLPIENKYFVRIQLNNNLTTTYNKALPFKQQLKGETEIITEDLRLLERVLYQFKSILSKVN